MSGKRMRFGHILEQHGFGSKLRLERHVRGVWVCGQGRAVRGGPPLGRTQASTPAGKPYIHASQRVAGTHKHSCCHLGTHRIAGGRADVAGAAQKSSCSCWGVAVQQGVGSEHKPQKADCVPEGHASFLCGTGGASGAASGGAAVSMSILLAATPYDVNLC